MSQPEKIHKFQVMLVCRTAAGQPTFIAANVECTHAQYDEVEHVDMMCEHAENKGFIISEGIPYLCDSEDSLGKILDYGADWDSAPVLNLHEWLDKQPKNELVTV